MNHNELIHALTAASIYPIPVEGDIDRDRGGLTFLGDLNAFIQAAKALNVRCVFVTSRILEESDFLEHKASRGLSIARAGKRKFPADPATVVDLCDVEPSMNEFKAHLGRECGYRITIVHLPNTTLEHVLHLPWWQKFSELREQAVEKVLQEQELAISKQTEEEEQRGQQILIALQELINDPEFVRLPTQRAMQAYAFERIMGLDTINPNKLKLEIQSLDAKIKARGLGRKK